MDKVATQLFSKKALEKFGSIESSSTATISGTTIKNIHFVIIDCWRWIF